MTKKKKLKQPTTLGELKEQGDAECLARIPKLPDNLDEVRELLSKDFKEVSSGPSVQHPFGSTNYTSTGTVKCPFCETEFDVRIESGCFHCDQHPSSCPCCGFPGNVWRKIHQLRERKAKKEMKVKDKIKLLKKIEKKIWADYCYHERAALKVKFEIPIVLKKESKESEDKLELYSYHFHKAITAHLQHSSLLKRLIHLEAVNARR